MLVSVSWSSTPYAKRLDMQVGVQAGYTDNVNLSKDKQADIPVEVFTALHYQSESGKTSGALDARLGYKHYLEQHASDEIVPQAHGNLRFNLRPERLSWVLDADWSQARIDRLASDSPGNLENRLVLWTGPDIRIPVSSVSDLIAKGRAGYSHNSGGSSSTAPDDYRLGLELDFRVRKGAGRSAITGLQYRSVQYLDNAGQASTPDGFNIVNAFAGYGWRARGGTLDFKLGASSASSTGGDSQLGPFFQADADGPVGARGRVRLSARFGYQDEPNATLSAPVASAVSNVIDNNASGFYYEERIDASYALESRRATLLASLYLENRDFTRRVLDESHHGAGLSWNARLSRGTDARIYGQADWNEFRGVGANTRELMVGLSLGRRLTRSLSVQADVRQRSRISSDAKLGYDESAFILSFAYELDL